MHFVWNAVVAQLTKLLTHSAFQPLEKKDFKDKRITMVQYENGHWKDNFVNRTQ